MARLLVLLVVCAPAVAHAQPPGLTDTIPQAAIDGRDTSRVMVGAGGAVFASYPMSMEDPGVALFAAKPLWLGNRYRFFQWSADVNALLGVGTEERNGYLLAGAQFGPNFYLGGVFGLEFRFGLDGMVQVGEHSVAGLTIGGGGAYVFRFWDDDRKRIKLLMQMHFGGYFANDPDNDLGMNAGAISLGLGYETPI
ncbi:MAG TPA: hypothetical protein VIV40_13725 [Kofleriaceae bacterium]|jgi:hypothetical protein